MKTFSKDKSGANLLLMMALVLGLVIAATALVSCEDESEAVTVTLLALDAFVPTPMVWDVPTEITEFDTKQYKLSVTWLNEDEDPYTKVDMFEPSTVYKAKLSLTAKTGYTFKGLAANSFTYTGATVSNNANSGIVTITFPATGTGATNRYITVPYETESAASEESYLDKLIYSGYDDDNYYYVFLLGNINKVPIAYREAAIYDGNTPIEIGYTKTETTQEAVAHSMTAAVTNSVTRSKTLTWNVSISAHFEQTILGAKVSENISSSIGGSSSTSNTDTRSTSDTYQTTQTKISAVQDSIKVTIGNHNEPAGKYRYTYFGTTDVYYVLKTNKTKNAVTESYFALCARPLTYAWGVDYEPEPNGTFGKTGSGDLLVEPDVILADLPSPEDKVDFEYVPGQQDAEKPVANPPGGSYTQESSLTVELSSSTPNAEIYYTTDGKEPKVTSTLYKNPIILGAGTTTIKAVAIANGFNKSAVMSETYAIVKTAWQETRTNEIFVSDSDVGTKKEEFTADFDVVGLQAAGYTNLNFTIDFDAKEDDDGWVDVLVVKGHRGHNAAYLYAEHSDVTYWLIKKGEYDPPSGTWTKFSPTCSVSISDFSNEFTMVWGAHGDGEDDWYLGSRTITITAVKQQE